jgi:hypothetical protein
MMHFQKYPITADSNSAPGQVGDKFWLSARGFPGPPGELEAMGSIEDYGEIKFAHNNQRTHISD